MSNFGCGHLRVVNPFPAAFREARSAVGAAALLAGAEEFTKVADAVADCALVVGTTAARRRQLHHPLRRLEAGAPLIRRCLASSRVALLFGSEKIGLTNEALSHCHWLMRIPAVEPSGSMNLGQAVAVCLYELARRKMPAPQPAKIPRAAAAEVERITLVLLDMLRASGYMKVRASALTEGKVRRMVRRLELSAADAEVLLGMLRQIAWRLSSGEEPRPNT